VIALDPRTRLEVLSEAVCKRLLRMHHLGRLGVITEGRPLVLPVNYAFDGDHVFFRTDAGTKLHAAIGHPVAFEIDGVDNVWHSGWSVVVAGRADVVSDDEQDDLSVLPLGPWCPGPKRTWVRVTPDEISGRRIVPIEVARDGS
jgi:nitroimidazol reductase NimA-like FMN-containing flavoprotein (pyridoxamine 5'-phosphate oxidase superfamily)